MQKVLLVVLKGEETDIRAAATKISVENQLLLEKLEMKNTNEQEENKKYSRERLF